MKTYLVCLLIGLVTSICLSVGASDAVVDRFVIKYKSAKTEIQKRTICIDLIDKGVLYDGSPVADLRRVFQNDFLEAGMADQTNNGLAIVYFVPPDHTANPMVQVANTGWYLAITYRENDGSVIHYHLSNEGKDLNTAALHRQLERQQMENRINMDIGLPTLELPNKSIGNQ